MSSYKKLSKHPITGNWEEAEWLDDYFGRHYYGVSFPNDPIVHNPEQVLIETK